MTQLQTATTDDLLAFLRSDSPVPKRAARVANIGQLRPTLTNSATTLANSGQRRPTANPAKLREMAERLESQIEDKRRPMTQNPTPKRNREYASRRIDGDHLDRARAAMLALADAIERGDLPAVLVDVKTKAEILPMVRTRSESSGYYSIYDTGEYHDKSAAAVALRVLAGMEKATISNKADLTRREIAMENIPGFWPTPDDICRQMVDLADVDGSHDVLEPSCGWGSIADAIAERGPRRLDCVEYCPRLAKLAATSHAVSNEDIFEWQGQYDRILMNPPFEQGQDMEHVRHCFEKLLRPGGRLVAIVSRGVQFRSDRKTVAFRETVDQLGGELTELPDDTFDRPGQLKRTGVSACLLVLDKPEDPAATVLEPAIERRSQTVLF